MTTTQSTTADHPLAYVHLFTAMDLVPPLFAKAHDHLDAPTPCDGFTVADLLHHLQMVIRRVDAVGQGLPAMSVPQDAAPEPDTVAVWDRHAPSVRQHWATLALDRALSVPWGEQPAAGVAGVYTSEFAVHAWDLATATGQTVDVPADVAESASVAFRQILPIPDRDAMFEDMFTKLPPEIPRNRPFGNAADVTGSASTFEQLLAWTGRDITWTPAR